MGFILGLAAGGRCLVERFQTSCTQHNSTKCKIAEYPCQHDGTTESFVVICLTVLFRNDLDLFWRLHRKLGKFGFILCIEVAVILGNVHVHLATGFEGCRWQLLGLVIALGTPGDIMGVAEGVDVKDVDVGRGQKYVLNELWRELAEGQMGWMMTNNTEVNICQGSRKINDAMNHMT